MQTQIAFPSSSMSHSWPSSQFFSLHGSEHKVTWNEMRSDDHDKESHRSKSEREKTRCHMESQRTEPCSGRLGRELTYDNLDGSTHINWITAKWECSLKRGTPRLGLIDCDTCCLILHEENVKKIL